MGCSYCKGKVINPLGKALGMIKTNRWTSRTKIVYPENYCKYCGRKLYA